MSFGLGLIKGIAGSIDRELQSDMARYENFIDTTSGKLFDTRQSNYQKYTTEFSENKKIIKEIAGLLKGDVSATQYLVDTEGLDGALAQAQLIGQKVTESGGMLHPVNDFIKVAREPNVNISIEQLAQSYTTPYKTMPLGPMKPQGYMSFFDDDMTDNITSISNRMLDVAGIPRGDLGGGDGVKKAYDLAGTRGIRIWELNAPTDNGERSSYLQNVSFVARRKGLLLEAAEIQHAADQASILDNFENKTDLSPNDRTKIKKNFLERLSIVHGTITENMYQMGAFTTGGMEATQLQILTEKADTLMNVLDTAMEHGVSYAEANYNINEAIRQNKGISFFPITYEDDTTAPDDKYIKGKGFVMTETSSLVNASRTYGDHYGSNISPSIGLEKAGDSIFPNSLFHSVSVDPLTAIFIGDKTVQDYQKKYRSSNTDMDRQGVESKLREYIKNRLPKDTLPQTINNIVKRYIGI